MAKSLARNPRAGSDLAKNGQRQRRAMISAMYLESFPSPKLANLFRAS